MGYTHKFYYKKPFTPLSPKKWKEFTDKVCVIIAKAKEKDGIVIVDGNGNPYSFPIVTDEYISINGRSWRDFEIKEYPTEEFEMEGYETLLIERDPTSNSTRIKQYSANVREQGFRFCKTEHKKYDSVVLAILVEFKETFKSLVDIDSDGGSKVLVNSYKDFELRGEYLLGDTIVCLNDLVTLNLKTFYEETNGDPQRIKVMFDLLRNHLS